LISYINLNPILLKYDHPAGLYVALDSAEIVSWLGDH